jgi:alcohol dehydrogenase
MRQLTVVEPERAEWLEVPDPPLEDSVQALVRPLAVALCDLDHAIVTGAYPIPPPLALGHECVAEVLEVGEDVRSVSPGDRVVVPFQISCGECERCRRGHTGNCSTVPRLSMYGFGQLGGDWGGLLSDVARVPYADAMLVPLPDGVDAAAVASASDNIVDGWRTVAPPLDRRPGAEVLVIGGGARSIALYAVEIAEALGASRVVYVDSDPERLRTAESLGAEPVQFDDEPPRRAGSFEITVDAGGTRESLACALRSTEPLGLCTSVGILFEPETPLPLLEMYTSGVELTIGRPMARPTIPKVLDLVAAGRIHPERVTSAVTAWDDAAGAVGEAQTKLVVAR